MYKFPSVPSVLQCTQTHRQNTIAFYSNTMYNITYIVCVCPFVDAQSCPTICDPMECSLPGSSVYGIFQARILDQVTISYSRGSLQTWDQTSISSISCIGRWILYHSTTCNLCNKLFTFIVNYNLCKLFVNL